MNSTAGFLDLLFILLLATLGMLSESVRLSNVELAPATAGGGGVSAIAADDVAVLAVADDHLIYDDQTYVRVADLPDTARPGPRGTLLVVPTDDTVPHQAVITAWSDANDRGWTTALGVRPKEVAEYFQHPSVPSPDQHRKAFRP